MVCVLLYSCPFLPLTYIKGCKLLEMALSFSVVLFPLMCNFLFGDGNIACYKQHPCGQFYFL